MYNLTPSPNYKTASVEAMIGLNAWGISQDGDFPKIATGNPSTKNYFDVQVEDVQLYFATCQSPNVVNNENYILRLD